MAAVINRTTKEVRRSINTPDFDPAEWLVIAGEDADAMSLLEPAHRVIEGGSVRAATSAEIDAAEAAGLPSIKSAAKAALTNQGEAVMAAAGYSPTQMILGVLALQEATAENDTTALALLEQVVTAAKDLAGRTAAARASIDAATTASAVRAVALNLDGLTIPEIDIAAIAAGA